MGRKILLRLQGCISPTSSTVTSWCCPPVGNSTRMVKHVSSRTFPTQGLNLGLLHCRQILYHLSHQGSQLWRHGRYLSWSAHRVLGTIWILNHHSMDRVLQLLLCYRCRNSGEANLPKRTKTVSGRAGVQYQASLDRSAYTYALTHSALLPYWHPRLCLPTRETQLFSWL